MAIFLLACSQADQKYLVGFTIEIEHARLASVCLTYLAFEVFREQEVIDQALRSHDEPPLFVKEHLMLEYATSNWIHHISTSADAGTQLLNRVLQFLKSMWI